MHKPTQRTVLCGYQASRALYCALLNRLRAIRWHIIKAPFQKAPRALCSKERRNLHFIPRFHDQAKPNGILPLYFLLLTKEFSLPGEKQHSREVDLRSTTWYLEILHKLPNLSEPQVLNTYFTELLGIR